jgi:hypothetical protein
VFVQDDQNGQKTIGLPSAAMSRLTPSKQIFCISERFNMSADGNPIMNLPCFTRTYVLSFFIKYPTSIRLLIFL